MRRIRTHALVGTVIAVALLTQGADRYVATWTPGEPPVEVGDLTCYDCNLVLISIDTLRPDHLGCYGYGRPTSPAIDEFCRSAVVFNNAIAPAPSTLPSHASLFTGLIPQHHGAKASTRTPLADEYLTLAELFSAIDFATAAFVDGGQMNPQWNLDQGFDLYNSQSSAAYLMNTFADRVDEAVDWLRTTSPDRYMLFLHTYEVHHPYTPSPEALAAVAPRRAGNMETEFSVQTLRRINNGRIELTGRRLRDIVTTYDAEIRSMDSGFASLLEGLRQRPDWDRTVVVLLSDHGEEFSEHERVGWHSHTLYDELLRVPLVIRLPGEALAGRRVDEMVRLIDVAPTIADLFDLPGIAYEGTSLLSLAAGHGRAVVPSTIAQRDRWQEQHPTALRTPRWKLYSGQLFDLLTDPAEQIDQAARHPTVVAALEAEIERLISAATPMPTDSIEIDDDLREQLRSLGYIQ